MPVVLIPIHFDRDPANRIPSCARSIVLRPFLSSDFMTGVPILPGSDKLSGLVSLIPIRYSYYPDYHIEIQLYPITQFK